MVLFTEIMVRISIIIREINIDTVNVSIINTIKINTTGMAVMAKLLL